MLQFTEITSSLGLDLVIRIVFSIIKYLIAAGIGYGIFYVWKRRDWYVHKIQQKFPSNSHLRHELFWSVVSRMIFGLIAFGISVSLEYTSIYLDVQEYGIPYLIASFIGLVFVHDAYFYWAHWLMHKPALYKHVHKVHHHSTNPTPLAAFSFHPSEALVEAAIFPVLLFFVPLHPLAFFGLLIFQIIFNIYGHSGFELMPRWWVKNGLTKYINTSTHHNLHHKEFNYNFGLYFNHWDRWFNTLDSEYNQKFYAIKDRVKEVDSVKGMELELN